MNRDEILGWLREEDAGRLDELWRRADAVRRENVGDEVHLRGLIEFSNICRSNCLYCGMRRERRSLRRYRMTSEEILVSAREAAARGYGTVVLQSAEDPGIRPEWLAGVIRSVKSETPLAVTLSCGERSPQELECWRQAGADRYFLRFETSDRFLWMRIHPPRTKNDQHRIGMLRWIRDLGYETGSGIMVGIPGQTWSALADDIDWLRRLELDMIGSGPYVAHVETPLGRSARLVLSSSNPHQVPDTELMTYKVMALTRLVCPRVNMPATTALATLNRGSGSQLGLQRGANVLMVNLTPIEYRALYDIYPAKACVGELPDAQQERVAALLAGLGRRAGAGPGASPNYHRSPEPLPPACGFGT